MAVWRVVIYDLLLTFPRGQHRNVDPSGEKIRHGDGEVADSARVLRSADSDGVLHSPLPRFAFATCYEDTNKVLLTLLATLPQLCTSGTLNQG